MRFAPNSLRAARRAAGLSRTQLAYHLGVNEKTVAGWEVGRHAPLPLETRLPAIAKVLGIKPEDLVTTETTDAPADHR